MWSEAKRLIIVARTSWHAGLVAEYMFEDFVRIPVEVEYASEFRYRNLSSAKATSSSPSANREKPPTPSRPSGWPRNAEPMSSASAMWSGSSISRESDSGAYTHAGPNRCGLDQSLHRPADRPRPSRHVVGQCAAPSIQQLNRPGRPRRDSRKGGGPAQKRGDFRGRRPIRPHPPRCSSAVDTISVALRCTQAQGDRYIHAEGYPRLR